jgi:hypothetical protein
MIRNLEILSATSSVIYSSSGFYFYIDNVSFCSSIKNKKILEKTDMFHSYSIDEKKAWLEEKMSHLVTRCVYICVTNETSLAY